ncbi:hypothetical protein KJ996_01760, partial [Patescibacteria group bacterium]|nr:hypothetical protein [Patescibacteria group bacterium]
YTVPPPTLCPTCRYQRRLMFRNEDSIYKRKSDLSGKEIVSIYAPDAPYKVYDQDEWWSDDWDPLEYGRDFDFSKSFTEQFIALTRDTPHASLYTTNVENSYYTNYALNLRNCYLVFGVTNGEDNLYGHYVINCKDTVDSLSTFSCESCYEGIASKGCYQCQYFRNCRNCSDCFMIDNCVNCKNCIESFGLRGREYCYKNKYVGEDEIKRIRKDISPLTHKKIADMRNNLDELRMKLPHPNSYIIASENCTGDTIFNSKNCQHCFDIDECEDCKYLSYSPRSNNSQDTTFNAPDGLQWSYEMCCAVGNHTCLANFLSWYNSNTYYSFECHNSHYLFGCSSLNKKEYCIFNKQYTQIDYEILVPKIIEHMQKTGEWGEYLSTDLSPFAYNETKAHDEFPLSKEEVIAKGWTWREETDEMPDVEKIIPANKLPDSIDDIPDDILNWAVKCEITGRPFKIVQQELKFYRKMGLPIPHAHPDERYRRRMMKRNPRKLWERTCDKCSKEMQTTYAPERPETVYCEHCYLQTIY